MPSGYRLNWEGDGIHKRTAEASRRGIDQTMAEAVTAAKGLTPVVTGTAQGSIQLRPARIERHRVAGRWGSFDVNYFIWLEIGARGRAGIHMLRRSADREYPNLIGRIRAFL